MTVPNMVEGASMCSPHPPSACRRFVGRGCNCSVRRLVAGVAVARCMSGGSGGRGWLGSHTGTCIHTLGMIHLYYYIYVCVLIGKTTHLLVVAQVGQHRVGAAAQGHLFVVYFVVEGLIGGLVQYNILCLCHASHPHTSTLVM